VLIYFSFRGFESETSKLYFVPKSGSFDIDVITKKFTFLWVRARLLTYTALSPWS